MQEDINQLKTEIETLKERVNELESALSITGMSYDLKEIIRNEVIKGESSLTTLTEVYITDALDEVTAPKSYNGALIFQWRGREYVIPTIAR